MYPTFTRDGCLHVYSNICKVWRSMTAQATYLNRFVQVRPSHIQDAGDGLFALTHLQTDFCLGNPFGVIQTSEELDILYSQVPRHELWWREPYLQGEDSYGNYLNQRDESRSSVHRFMNHQAQNPNVR